MRRKCIPFLAAASLFATTALADTVQFSGGAGNVGTTKNYTLDSATIAAAAFNGGSLFGKNSGDGEVGLGLTGDPSGESEIFVGSSSPQPFVQLNLMDLLNKGFTHMMVEMNSVQAGEAFMLEACSGSGGTGCVVGVTSTTGGVFLNLPGNFSASTPFLDIFASGGTGANVLLAGISATPAAVPEPRSMILLGTGFSGLAAFFRRKRTLE